MLKGLGIVGLTSTMGTATATTETWSGPETEMERGSQLYTYNRVLGSEYSVADFVYLHAESGYDVFEPYFIDDPQAVLTAIEETGVEMPTAHTGLVSPETMAEDEFQATIELYTQLGTEWLITPYMSNWESKTAILEWAQRLNRAGTAVFERSGGTIKGVGYHNHDHEFATTFDGESGYDIFAEAINDHVHLQVDIGWAFAGGVNPISFLNRHRDSIGSLHVKDFRKLSADTYEMVDIEKGDVPLRGVLNVARAATECEYCFYEYDGAPAPIKSLYRSARLMDRWNGPQSEHPHQ